jgi:predicted Zn-dependent peptidase
MKGDSMSYKKKLFELTIQKMYAEKHEGYSLPIIGNTDTLNSINAKSLKKFFDTYYHYDNSVLVIVGNMNYTSIEKYIKTLVNKYPRSGEKTSDLVFKNTLLTPSMYLYPIEKSSQTIMMVSFYISNLTEKEKIHLFLLHHILTGNFMSIFFHELRVKRGLCYGVNSDNILIKTDNVYNGLFFIKVDADPSKIKECLKLILEIMLTKKIKQSNFLASKKSLNNIVSFSFQTSKDYLYFYGDMILNNDTILPTQILSLLEKTILSDINNLLDKIKKGNLFVNMIGDYR